MTYSVNYADDDQRTMSVEDIVRAYKAGEISVETYVWAEGMDDWLPLSNVPPIMKAINDTGSAGAAPARAARREPSRGAIDLFGGADEPPPSAGGGAGGAGEPAFTGQRNEQSVLFSLSALGAPPPDKGSGGKSSASASGSTPAVSAGPSAAKPKTTEDSGLIDLSALAKAAEAQQQATQQPVIAPAINIGGMLGAPVLEAAQPAPATAPPPAQKSNTPIIVAAALIAAAILGVGAMMVFKGGDSNNANSASSAATAATSAPVAATTAPPTPTAETSATATDPTKVPPADSHASGAGGAKPGPAGGKGGAPPPPGKGGGAAPPPPPPPAPPPAPTGGAKGPCGCAPGDLSCAIACKAKK